MSTRLSSVAPVEGDYMDLKRLKGNHLPDTTRDSLTEARSFSTKDVSFYSSEKSTSVEISRPCLRRMPQQRA